MQVKDLFVRDIFRPINGVVKADQLDENSVWQELDEFVVTKELDQHLRKFFGWYLESIDEGKRPNPAGKMGVWLSGFFGSGKSHFLKVLSYLLKNASHAHNGQTKQAVEFFESKVQDAMLFGDIKRAVAADTDVILFNIDSKAEAKAGREAILAVFLKVLNEMQGYSPDHPHIAHMERYLESKGKLDTFKQAFEEASGSRWEDERDAYEFHHDQVIQAWCQATGQSETAAEKWIDKAEENFSLTVENFCKWVKEYLDSQGPDRRIIFLVDEVGQFIGSDGHLMLNLQTITEGLGTACQRREKLIQEWVTKNHAYDREFEVGHQTWRASKNLEPNKGYPGIRYVLLHTFAHALIRQLAIECGYTSASITERIYSRNPVDGDPMAGVLIYTAAPDSEGTLGGLCALGEPDKLGRHIRRALEKMSLCASDPLCSEHTVGSGEKLHGASCHACSFLPETSCERGNKYLDRSALVPTVERTTLAFFG